MELVSLSCNRVLISAESVERGWCKITIAMKWYQFHTTDKCGFLSMPWITDQYTFVWYTKLVNKIGTTVAKVITFSQLRKLSVTYTQYDMPPYPTPSKNCAWYFAYRFWMTTLWSACATMCRVNKWFADDVLCGKSGDRKKVLVMLGYHSIQQMLISTGKGSCRQVCTRIGSLSL